MDCFFTPRAIAVVGASPNPLKGGHAIVKNLLQGYEGVIYPVNPRYETIEGLPCYPSLKALPATPDLAIVFVPAPDVPEVVAAGAALGIPGVMIESGGFAETDRTGAERQQTLATIVRHTGIRVWGPNCMGLVDAVHHHIFSFMDPETTRQGLTPGTVSLIVQSGMLSAGFLVDLMSHATMGISKVCSVGNKVDVNECDLLEYFITDPDTQVVGLYLESFPQGRRFLEICRRCSKPVVVLKGGQSPQGARSALSHTASLAGNREVVAGALSQAGVFEARDFKQMTDLCRSLALSPPATGKRVAVLTFSGGAGIVGTDFLSEHGLNLADLSPGSLSALALLFPPWMPVANPVDLWPAIERHLGTDTDVLTRALAILLDDPQVDAVFLHAYAGGSRFRLNLTEWARLFRKAAKPLFLWLLGHRAHLFPAQQEALSLGIPAFQELSRAAEGLAAALRVKPQPLLPSLGETEPLVVPEAIGQAIASLSGPLDEYRSKTILKALGLVTVPERLAVDDLEAEAAANALGYPVVLKGILPGAIHKTELGLVRLGINGPETLQEGIHDLWKRMGEEKGRLLVQRQLTGRVELIVGLLRDPQFGPCVLFGLGGVMAELYRDAAFAVAPLTRIEALALIARVRGQAMLDGFRGKPPVDREALAALLVRIGQIGLALPAIREIDINPLLAMGTNLTAVDATLILEPSGAASGGGS